MLIGHAFAYLTKIPREYFVTYEGQSDPVVSTPEDFCHDTKVESYTPNMELEDSYDNWVTSLNLHCASGTKIGFLGGAFFLGWAITVLFLPRISDLFGRQKIIILGTVTNFISYTIMILATNYPQMIFSMIIMGFAATVR